LLFAGVGASRTLDYFSTLNMRARGRQEILLNNDVVDNHAAFATIEAAGNGRFHCGRVLVSPDKAITNWNDGRQSYISARQPPARLEIIA